MARIDTSQICLGTGLMLSLLGHAAVWVIASGFVRIGREDLANSDPAKPQQTPSAVTQPIKLGIDDGRIDTLAWLGYRDPTPNQGLAAAIEQSAMTPTPDASGAAPAVPAPIVNAMPPAPLVSSRQIREAASNLADLGDRVAKAVEALAKAMPSAPENSIASNPKPESAGGGGGDSDPGLASDKESIATSIDNAPTIRLGQVAAAYGLDIQTKKPNWSITTLQTQRPSNPTLRITFGRDGKVVKAEFASIGQRKLSTGSAEVDEPLLTAVYSWTARGKRLAELTSQDPKGEVTIFIRVLLVG